VNEYDLRLTHNKGKVYFFNVPKPIFEIRFGIIDHLKNNG